MKRTERHRLKENELAHAAAFAGGALAERKRLLTRTAVVLAVALVALSGWLIWRQQTNAPVPTAANPQYDAQAEARAIAAKSKRSAP